MANTVNDVMNVIASPDYGIKNIAGTNQEILAILQGTHNSKNNIHAIVNDIKSLLQELVNVESNKNKTVEIKGNQTKLSNGHIKDILDETKGIRKAIDNLSKSFSKQGKTTSTPAVAKLSDKASEEVAKAMINSINKQNKGGGLTAIVDAFEKLKNISLKDIIVGKIKLNHITKIFNKSKENLKDIKEKDLESIIKLIKSAPEMVKSLTNVGWGVNRIIKNNIIGKLSDILVGKNSILSLSTLLKKNKKEFISAKESVKNIVVLIGNLFVPTILLTTISITGAPALLGATLLEKIVDKIIPIAKTLTDNNKKIKKATKSALSLTVFTGLMAVSSLFLSTIAVTGAPALLGAILMVGIIKITSLTFKMLSKAKKNILIGSISMLAMSTSLLLFGIALKKIVDATKGVKFKQIGVIATLTVLLGGIVAALGIPAVVPFILLGSASIAAIGLALIPFAKSLSIISKSTKSLKMKDILLISGSMLSLGLAVAGMGYLSIPIAIGSVAIAAMSFSVRPFMKTINAISKSTKSLKMEDILLLTGSMMSLGISVASMGYLSIPITIGSMVVRTMTNVIHKFAKTLKKIKDLGGIPTKIVYQTLNTLGAIGKFFMKNILKERAVKNAKRYKDVLRPFGKTIKHLSKLKEMGVIPMKLVHQALNAMSFIANYYIDNPIRKRAIKQAKRYKKILRPFGKTIKHLSKLKEMGSIPIKLVHQALNAMGFIANYYIDNPIRKRAIKQAKRYKKILRPFGKTIKYLSELKEINSNQILSSVKSMSVFFRFLKYNSLNRKQRKKAIKSIVLLKDMVSIISTISNINSSNILSVGDAMSNTVNGVNTVDISKVEAVTNMFNAFNGINKSESMISKFTESVKEFTESCKNLMNAMSDNTNAINNIDGIGVNGTVTNEINKTNIVEKSSNGDDVQTSGIRITNVDEIAKTIAEKINGALSIDVPDAQIQLLINGTGGNEWTITRY